MYPALAVAEALQSPAVQQYFVGSVGGFERPLVENSLYVFSAYDEVRAGPLHGVNPLKMLASLANILAGTVQSIGLLRKYRPNAILLTGGWVGLPIALAAWLLRVPSLIFLPDVEPGLAIKVLRYITDRVAIAMPESAVYFPPNKTIQTGYPIRMSVEQATREDGLAHFGLAEDRPILLVFGGSRGAQTINRALVACLPQLLGDGIQVLHVTGTLDWDTVLEQTIHVGEGYHPYPYLHDDMGLALACADLVLSRSGAGVLGEFPLFGLAAILVPYPFAWRYQKVNADYLTERGAAVTLPDEDMPAKLYATIRDLLLDGERLAAMRTQAKHLAQPGAARRIAEALLATGEKETE